MDKEKILSRLNSKDYNNELESILEDKPFSEQVKNLLLSMLYKIETGYTDYTVVKRVVENRKSYIEHILSIIKEKAQDIRIVEEESEQAIQIRKTKKKYRIEKLERTIELIHPNEKDLLYSLYELDDRQIYLDEKYNLIRNSLSELLNAGENINSTEVLRDFNGWSWDIASDGILNPSINLIYQNLIYLLGIDCIKQWVHTNEVSDYVQMVQQRLEKEFGEEYANQIVQAISILSILICTKTNSKEKERLLEEKAQLEKELTRLENKTALLNEVSNTKKEALEKIRQIDAIMNDKKLLEQEYIKQNEKRPEYNKIFSLSHLTEILTRQRKKLLVSMEEANKILDPTYYIQVKQNLETQISLVKGIECSEEEQEKIQCKEIIELQKLFLNCFNNKIEQTVEKEEIIDFICMLRYYRLSFGR